eukprot:CAMPEP_0172598374 /NCGR_PEP_ID=MMETSP1068-20121228/18409_1 /TAXON_ID=35684 /ORGANISM="Pseudopedinella elastica, Strain CCMP716" /LENGTH=59 /DNA_ID=CAMNT_0013398221 /DNA_START=685 /DNA_END=861 /DNA_ORIENTATION=-
MAIFSARGRSDSSSIRSDFVRFPSDESRYRTTHASAKKGLLKPGLYFYSYYFSRSGPSM